MCRRKHALMISKIKKLPDDVGKIKETVNVRPKYACKKCEGTSDESKPAVKITPVPLWPIC